MTSRSPALLILCLIAGLGGGFALGYGVAGSTDAGPATDNSTGSAPAANNTAPADNSPAPAGNTNTDAASSDPGGPGPLTDESRQRLISRLAAALGRDARPSDIAQLDAAIDGLRRSWEEGLLAVPGAVANRIHDQEAALEAAQTGDVARLLELHANDNTAIDPSVVTGDRAAFDRIFADAGNGVPADADVLAVASHDPVPEQATISLGAGVHTWQPPRNGWPEGVLIQGMDVDLTMLRMAGDVPTRVVRLVLRDLTLDCANHYFTDLRGADVCAIRLERCRVIGFDSGAGASTAFSCSSSQLIHAVDCEFVSGYGRSPGRGVIVEGRSCMARFDNCRFVGPFRRIVPVGPACHTHFTGCTLSNAVVPPANPSVTFESSEMAGNPRAAAQTRKRGDINPQWAQFD